MQKLLVSEIHTFPKPLLEIGKGKGSYDLESHCMRVSEKRHEGWVGR